jgi:putative spermidine/putrescine transport system ATP-binding protein
LELKGLRKSYGDAVAVHGVDLVVADGEFLTLLGPSGSGKTSILGMVAGYLRPDGGSMTLGGRDLMRMPAAQRGIGVVFQDYALFPHLNVSQNIAYGLRRRKWSKKAAAARVEEMLELIGLGDLAHRRPAELSGGQQQRVALARALAFTPALLLMDEPLGALDREIRDQMQEHIRRIHRQMKPTVLYVTHNKEEAYALADRVAIMQAGSLIALDTPYNLRNRPESSFIARFFGGHLVIPVSPTVGSSDGMVSVSLAGQTMSLPAPTASTPSTAPTDPADQAGATGPVRRMDLAIFDEGLAFGTPAAGEIGVAATVEDVLYTGGGVRVACATPLGRMTVGVRTGSGAVPTQDDRVTIRISPGSTRLVRASGRT